MGDSATPKPPEPLPTGPWAGPDWEAFAPPQPLVVALSGGADSTALLLACHQRWPGQVQAVHVNHGLQASAANFERHCQTLCQRLGVPLSIHRLSLALQPGQSLEQEARQVRYEALARAALALGQGAGVVLAHHADDQVETVLLALTRGAGLPGLAAMPERMERHGVVFFRPWLSVPGEAIRAWLTQVGVPWEEDPSNQDERFTRNRIRHQVLPVLQAQFPAMRTTFARTAQHAAQAQALLLEVGQADLAQCGQPPRIAALQALSEARLHNVLRVWLNAQNLPPSTAQLQALVSQIRACQTRGHHIDLKVGQGRVVRKGEALVGYNRPLDFGPEAPTSSL